MGRGGVSQQGHAAFGALILLMISGPPLLCLQGCGTPVSEAEPQKPALTINALKLTPAELRQELAASAAAFHELPAAEGEEPEWLSRLIERELLVQEAQRLGLDRERDFMRTIERFWKEALIKQLLDRKGREITAEIRVYEPEIEAAYERLSQEGLARILSFADAASASHAAQAGDLEEDLAASGPALLDDSGWQWYTAGMLDPSLESVLAGTEPGTRSDPVMHRGRWVVVALAQRRGRAIEPLPALRDEIRRSLQDQKETDALDQWVTQLRDQARIVIDHDAIATLR